jgi:hypothetical protein
MRRVWRKFVTKNSIEDKLGGLLLSSYLLGKWKLGGSGSKPAWEKVIKTPTSTNTCVWWHTSVIPGM